MCYLDSKYHGHHMILVEDTLLGTNISFSQGNFQDEFPIPQVGYVCSLEGM